MVSPHQTPTRQTVSRLLSVLAIVAAGIAVTWLLLPDPLADVFFAGTMLLSVGFTFVGAVGAWTNRTPLVWMAALLLTGLTILAMLSVGFVLVPASLLLLGAAIFSQLAGPRPAVRDAIVATPPSERELVWKSVVGIGLVVGGVGLVSVGAFAQELFGACANETLACALETTNWDAVGLTVLGSSAIGLGGWLLWKQAAIARLLASTQTQ